jgi:hypothetical protein
MKKFIVTVSNDSDGVERELVTFAEKEKALALCSALDDPTALAATFNLVYIKESE